MDKIQVYDYTQVEAAVVLTVRVVKEGKVYEEIELIPLEATRGFTLSAVGSYLQRAVFEMLRSTYRDSLNEENCIGTLQPLSK